MSDSDIKRQVRLSWFDAPETIRLQDGAPTVELIRRATFIWSSETRTKKEISI